MKENNGKAARQKFLKKLGTVLFIFVCLMGALIIVEYFYTDPRHHHGGGGQRQSLFNKLRRAKQQYKHGPKVSHGKNSPAFERILAGELNLINIEADPIAIRRADAEDYEGVFGTFCQLNWAAHKEDPSAVPMFRDVQAASPDCERTKVTVPLKEVAALARDMDDQNDATPTSSQIPKPLNFSGIVFHESRCGSTLVANTLIAMDPAHHRVYSESPPPVAALKVCGDEYEKCNIDQAAALLKDVLYMMGRTNDPKEERLFFKIQSVGSRQIEVFRRAFPTTPWIFVYREPVQVMMSHLANGIKHANCLRSFHRPSAAIKQLIEQHGYEGGPAQMSPEEFCAAHLATITETALQNLKESGGYGTPVNYESLPQIMFDTILPEKMGVLTGQSEIDRILQVSSTYSKGRGGRKHEWKEDSEQKEEEASKVIRKAAKHFMLQSYDALQELSGGGNNDDMK